MFVVSATLEAFQQYAQTLENLAMWADVLRQDTNRPLAARYDAARINWDPFFETLEEIDGPGIARLFDLPSDRIPPEVLQTWAELAQRVGRSARHARTEGDRPALYRFYNKAKHGLHVVAVRDHDNDLSFAFPPEHDVRDPHDLWVQKAGSVQVEFFLREAFAVSRLTAALVQSWFVARFGHDPRVLWAGNWPPPSASLDEIRAFLSGNLTSRLEQR
ncbi:MAG: hypothetical protein C4558_04880 [Dehalococcoidia bacterium]|nr:MAG: hypothetical protein C4558_04880 [Dehalococcoidia bacterium]